MTLNSPSLGGDQNEYPEAEKRTGAEPGIPYRSLLTKALDTLNTSQDETDILQTRAALRLTLESRDWREKDVKFATDDQLILGIKALAPTVEEGLKTNNLREEKTYYSLRAYLFGLSFLGDKESLQKLYSIYADFPQVERVTFNPIYMVNNREAAPTVIELIKNYRQNEGIVIGGLSSLGNIGDRGSIGFLMQEVNEVDDVKIKVEAMFALAEIGKKSNLEEDKIKLSDFIIAKINVLYKDFYKQKGLIKNFMSKRRNDDRGYLQKLGELLLYTRSLAALDYKGDNVRLFLDDVSKASDSKLREIDSLGGFYFDDDEEADMKIEEEFGVDTLKSAVITARYKLFDIQDPEIVRQIKQSNGELISDDELAENYRSYMYHLSLNVQDSIDRYLNS